jgi:purine nucleosidase/pyrimidine-specific ribonucleoside hydrolase
MKRKGLRIAGIVVGLLVLLLIILGGPAAPLLTKLGIDPICIQGDFPNIRVVSCPQPTATPLPLPTPAGQAPIPVIFDDDGSPDGVIALLFFLRHPFYDVKAVTVSPGEAHPELFAHHVTQLLAVFGRTDIPVGFGRATPLEGNNAFPEPWRQASDVFWDISLPQAAAPSEPLPAAELIVETLSDSTLPAMVFLSGTHTNLAEALRLDPSIGEQICGVYVMGGSIYVPGNIESDWPEIHNSVAEWNIWVDPVAASEVFASGLPLHIIPLDATDQVIWTKADAQAWLPSTIPETAMAGDVLDWMLRSWSPDGVYVWDLVAAAAATDSRLCPEIPLALDVLVDPGPEQGQTIVTDEPANASVCLNPDPEQIKARVAAILGQ